VSSEKSPTSWLAGWFVASMILSAAAAGLLAYSMTRAVPQGGAGWLIAAIVVTMLAVASAWTAIRRARYPARPAADEGGGRAAGSTYPQPHRAVSAGAPLERASRSLELLYDVAASINVSRDLKELLQRFLHTLNQALGAEASLIRLVMSDGGLQLMASVGIDPDQLQRNPPELDAAYCTCGKVLREGHVRQQADVASCCRCCATVAGFYPAARNLRMVVVPLQYRNKVFGVYNLYVEEQKLAAHEDIIVLLTSLGQHLGMAIERAGLDEETERLSRMEERTNLAHELHDSLAQTLASLRFQARILDEVLHQGDESATWQRLEQVETSIDEAYMELRELIARFRAPIDDHAGLVPSLEKTVLRFKEESGILTFFYNDLGDERLPESIQPQVVRIVQEALTNVRKHSQASAVRVMLRREGDDHYRVLIEDDGVGLDINQSQSATAGEHIGLSIMRERAEQIGAELKIESEPGEGTRVHLTFNAPEHEIARGPRGMQRAAN